MGGIGWEAISGENMGVQQDHHDILETLQIDPVFLVQQEHRPTLEYNDYKTAVGQHHVVPVIDLSPLTSKKEKEKEKKSSSGLESSSALTQQEHDAHSSIHNLVEQVGKACEEWGFFQVINHGVSLSLLEELESNAQSFFALPLQEKAKVRIT
jgi:hypothetical protein